MAAVYRTQGQNAQRLLAMNETLREKEDVARSGADELRRVKEELGIVRRKVEQHNELMAEKDERLQVSFNASACIDPTLTKPVDPESPRRDTKPRTGTLPS